MAEKQHSMAGKHDRMAAGQHHLTGKHHCMAEKQDSTATRHIPWLTFILPWQADRIPRQKIRTARRVAGVTESNDAGKQLDFLRRWKRLAPIKTRDWRQLPGLAFSS